MTPHSNNRSSSSSALFESIGCSVVSFQQIELWLSEVLAGLLQMKNEDDEFLVSAALSFGQKVDLLVALYPTRRPSAWQELDMPVVASALNAAEEFRNRVVHSYWAIESQEWIQMKGTLKGRKGLKLAKKSADVALLNECNKSLLTIRSWVFETPERLKQASQKLKSFSFS